jgi:PAS domain S-box-containing protein
MTQRHALFEHLNESVMTRSMEGIINFWNRSAEQLYGWRKEEAVGKVSHDLLQTQFPKPLEEIESELVRTGRWEGKLLHTTRDGGRVAVQSRWTFDLTEQSETVVEINTRATDIEARAEIQSVGSGRQRRRLARRKGDEISEKLGGFAGIVLVSGGVFCSLVSLYIFYHYGWSGQEKFASRFGMVVYFVFPAVLAALFFLSLRLGRIHKVKLAIFFLSSAISIYTVELFLTYSDLTVLPPGALWGAGQMRSQREKNAIVKLAKQFGVEFDTRTKLEIISELRKQGVDAVPSVNPSGLLKKQGDGILRSDVRINGTETLPLGGISNIVTVMCNETGNFAIYKSDEHGFRNPSGIWNLDRFDVAALGDSFTHGACVSSDRDFVAIIQKRYPATLNLGMSGNGPLLQLAGLREYLPRFSPRVVLWFFYEGNDLLDLKDEIKSPLLNRYAEEKGFNQDLLARQAGIDEALRTYINQEEIAQIKKEETARQDEDTIDLYQMGRIAKLSTLREKLGLVYGKSDQAASPTADVAELDRFGEILAEAKASVEAWGGTLYFVYLPDWYRYGEPQLADKNREAILRLAKSLNIPIIDLHPTFQAQGDPLSLFSFRRFGHYNEIGHRLVADEVIKAVSAGRLGQPREDVKGSSSLLRVTLGRGDR